MYLASAPTEVSGLTMLVVAIVVSLSLAAWLGLVFLADRQPRTQRTASASQKDEQPSELRSDEGTEKLRGDTADSAAMEASGAGSAR